jgi:hypothetical protein
VQQTKFGLNSLKIWTHLRGIEGESILVLKLILGGGRVGNARLRPMIVKRFDPDEQTIFEGFHRHVLTVKRANRLMIVRDSKYETKGFRFA